MTVTGHRIKLRATVLSKVNTVVFKYRLFQIVMSSPMHLLFSAAYKGTAAIVEILFFIHK